MNNDSKEKGKKDGQNGKSRTTDGGGKRSVRYYLKSISWKELFIGILLSAALSPLMSMAATSIYVDIGVYDSPDIEVEANRFPINSEAGSNLDQFSNLTWKEKYSLYSVRVKHQGGPDIEQLRVQPYLPECVVRSNVETSGLGDEIRILSLDPGYVDRQTELEGRQCAPIIELDSLPEGEEFEIEFVTTGTFRRCDLLLGLKSSPDISIEYSWTKSGVEFTPRRVGKVRLAADEYGEVSSIIDNSTELPFEGDEPAYIYDMESTDERHALSRCLNRVE